MLLLAVDGQKKSYSSSSSCSIQPCVVLPILIDRHLFPISLDSTRWATPNIFEDEDDDEYEDDYSC